MSRLARRLMRKPQAAASGPITTILRPDGTISNTSWTRFGGASDHGVLADDSDSTYLTPVLSADLKLNFGTAAALGTIHSVTTRIRCKMFGGLGTYGDQYDLFSIYQHSTDTSNGDSFDISTDGGGGTTAVLNGTAKTTKSGGGAWDQTAIDALVGRVICNNDASGASRLIEIFMVVSHTP